MAFGEINWSKCPVDYMLGGVQRYVERGIEPGHFLRAVLSNDLKESFKRADDENTKHMREWVAFIYWELPGGCHGSPEHVKDWCLAGGLVGMEKADASG